MNPQKNQGEESSPLMRDLQAEVSSESAPMLQFMLRHAGLIAGVVVLFLLILGGTAVWSWHSAGKVDEARQELARLSMTAQGEARAKALTVLAERAPDAVRFSVYLALAQNALESGDFAAAAAAFAKAAREDAEGALGAVAALGRAGALLKGDKAAEALKELQTLQQRLPAEARSVQLRQLLAEAAAVSGQKQLAADTYLALSQESQGLDRDYFRARAEALGAKLPADAVAPAVVPVPVVPAPLAKPAG